jgi:hypothetical protein
MRARITMFKMNRIPITVLASLVIVGAALGLAHCPGPAAAADSGSVFATSPGQGSALGAEFFRVEWLVNSSPNGQSTLTGYLYNDYGQPAKNVQLQITLVDTGGRPAGSVIRPVRGLVPAYGRAFFEFDVPPGDAAAQIVVASFDFLEFPSGR